MSMHDDIREILAEAEEKKVASKEKENNINRYLLILGLMLAVPTGYIVFRYGACPPEEIPISEGGWILCLIVCVLSSIGVIKQIVKSIIED